MSRQPKIVFRSSVVNNIAVSPPSQSGGLMANPWIAAFVAAVMGAAVTAWWPKMLSPKPDPPNPPVVRRDVDLGDVLGPPLVR